MKFGLYVPPLGEYADARTLANLAKDAEEAGWNGFFTWDHVVMDWPEGVVDPWIAYSAIAMNTQHIRFGPTVTPLPRRRPWKLARETVSLDRLSGGRLILGVGTGGGQHEFAYLGETSDPRERGAQLDEGLEVLTRLWSTEPVNFEGCYYQVKDACFMPGPVQSPRIPIWVGGIWPNKAPFRRAARWDGVFPLNRDPEGYITPEQIREITAYIFRFRESDAPFDVVNTGYTSGKDSARDSDWVGKYADAGVTWWLEGVNPWRFGWDMQGPWPIEAMHERILQGPPRI